MTDEDVVRKLCRITGIGHIYSSFPSVGKEIYIWDVGKQEDVVAIMMTLYSLMGIRRQEKIRELLAIWRSYPPKPKYKYSKLTDEQVREVRTLYKTKTALELAKKFGMSEGAIRNLLAKRSYRKSI